MKLSLGLEKCFANENFFSLRKFFGFANENYSGLKNLLGFANENFLGKEKFSDEISWGFVNFGTDIVMI